MAAMISREAEALATTAKGAPVTLARPANMDLSFEKPYLPRALKAVDQEHPYGTQGYPDHNLSVLQQHVAFFDRNGDGIIYPWETYTGFRAIGFNPIVSLFAVFVINGAFSFATVPGWLPSPTFAIYVKNIHKAKHGSDSGVYDYEGRYIPSKFEEIFAKFAKTYPDRLSFGELYDMTTAMHCAVDPFGWFANKFEWFFTYWLAKDEAGFLSKEAVRGVFDGSFFGYVEKEMKARKAQKQKKI